MSSNIDSQNQRQNNPSEWNPAPLSLQMLSHDFNNLSYSQGVNSYRQISSHDINNQSLELSMQQFLPSEKACRLSSPKTSHRLDNTFNSNAVRLLKQSIKEHFKSNQPVYEKFRQFEVKHQIKSQVWAFDGILTFLLFLRDEAQAFDSESLQQLKLKALRKMELVLKKTSNQLARSRIVKYKEYFQKFLGEGCEFSSIEKMKKLRENFLDSIISSKKSMIFRCMAMLDVLEKQLNKSVLQKKGPKQTNLGDDEKLS